MIESGRKSSSLVNCSRVSINLSVWLLIGLFSIVLRGLHVTGCQEPILFIFSILGNIPVKVLRRIVQYCQGQFTVPNNWAKVLFTSIMTQLAALMVRVILDPFTTLLMGRWVMPGLDELLHSFLMFYGSEKPHDPQRGIDFVRMKAWSFQTNYCFPVNGKFIGAILYFYILKLKPDFSAW